MRVATEFKVIEGWTHVQRPTDIAFDRDGRVYVSELWWRPGQESFTNGRIKYDLPGGVRENANTFQKFARC